MSGANNTPIQETGYVRYILNKSNVAQVFGVGGGDYHLQSNSPAIGMPIDWLLPYDLDGTARTLGDAAGVYTYQTAVVSGIIYYFIKSKGTSLYTRGGQFGLIGK